MGGFLNANSQIKPALAFINTAVFPSPYFQAGVISNDKCLVYLRAIQR